MKLDDVLKLRPEAAVHVTKSFLGCNGTTFDVVVGDVNNKDASFGNLLQCRDCKRDDLEFHNGKIVDLSPATP